MKNENELKPIQYVIENIYGIQNITHAHDIKAKELKAHDNSPIDFKMYASMIRIQSDEGTLLDKIVKNKFLLNGDEILLDDYWSGNSFPSHVKDIFLDVFIENTNDLIFELIENSKIMVTVFPKSKINFKRNINIS